MSFSKISILIILTFKFISCEEKTYTVPYHQGEIIVDGFQDEVIWNDCKIHDDFYSPWDDQEISRTEFKSFWNDDFMYFHFRITDATVICHDDKSHELSVEYSDRAEIFFAKDEQLSEYFGLEIDACGRMIHFKSKGYRNFEKDWIFPYFDKSDFKATKNKIGYEVEGRISLPALKELGILKEDKLLMGIFQADFTNPQAKKEVQWKSWKEITIEKPDFHTIHGFRLINLGDGNM